MGKNVVAYEKCNAEIGDLSSGKVLFRVNHASKNAQKKLEQKIIRWNFAPEHMD